jgi:hypothetical protein
MATELFIGIRKTVLKFTRSIYKLKIASASTLLATQEGLSI